MAFSTQPHSSQIQITMGITNTTFLEFSNLQKKKIYVVVLCSALLWHRLMGESVLSASHTGSSYLQAYAHCSKRTVSSTPPAHSYFTCIVCAFLFEGFLVFLEFRQALQCL